MPSVPIADIIALLGAELRGNGDQPISGVRPLNSANSGDLSFLFATGKGQASDLLELARRSSASAILVQEFDSEIQATQLKVRHPYVAVIAVIEAYFHRKRPEPGIHPTAVVDPSAVLGKNVHLGAYAVVGARCQIGDSCIIHPHVVVYSDVTLGAHCEIHSGAVLREGITLGEDCLLQPGAVIGGEGFGYIPDPKLGHRRIPHIGTVVLKDRVDLGANASVDRGTFGQTFLDEATKLDSLVQVGHNNQIGKRVLLCAMTGVGGSGSIGDDSVLGGHVGVADHITIGSKVRIGGKSGVGVNVESPGDYMGCPVPVPPKQHWRENALTARLPELFRLLKEQERRIAKLEANAPGDSLEPAVTTSTR